MLFLEVPDQGLVIGEMRSLIGMTEDDKRDLACRVLPARIRSSKADRLAWVMPAYKHDREPPGEALVVVLAEPGYREAIVVDIVRGDGPPRLGEWGQPAIRVTGLFADPLCGALLAKPWRPKWQRAQKRKRAGPSRRPTQSARKPERGGPDRSPAGRPLIPTCPDCGAKIGEPHRPRCDVEHCTVCLRQRLLCECPGHDPVAAAWEGEWPGASACQALGWWAVRTVEGWRPCLADTPGATEDLNRLAFFRETGVDSLYEEDRRWTE